MNLYIAFDHNSKPLSLLLAVDMTYAQVAFDAMNTQYYSIEEIDPMDVSLGQKVVYILTSKLVPGPSKFRNWVRGR